MIDHREHFGERAAEWDKDPAKVERSRRTAQHIVDSLELTGQERVFEFGAGTGLISQFLAPSVGSLTLADNSNGMREVIRQKIEAGVLPSAQLSDSDLVQGELPEDNYDMVVASLVLHHVSDVPALLASFASILAPGGVACIIELDPSGGKFHAHIDHYGGHDGFTRDSLEDDLKEAGFDEVQFHEAGSIDRNDGEEYSVYLANAMIRSEIGDIR